MPRRLYILLTLFTFSLSLLAQDFDLMSMSEQDLTGSARYTAMAGAMAAVGGDESAVKDNPAALGVFRRSGVMFTSAVQFDIAGTISKKNETAFSIPNVSILFYLGDQSRQYGVISNNFLFSYSRTKIFDRDITLTGLAHSLTERVADLTSTNAYSRELLTDTDPFNNSNIGWLSVLYYQQGLIKRQADGSWLPTQNYAGQVNTTLSISEWGSHNQYEFAWANNISHKLYLGAGVNIMTLNYQKEARLSESIATYELVSQFYTSGLGIQLDAGILYHPITQLRIGLAYMSPTWMTLKVSNTSTMYGRTSQYDNIYAPDNSYTLDKYILPMRSVVGLAYQFSHYGLISAEYDYTHQPKSTIPDLHMIKVGGEYVISDVFFIRAGYAITLPQKKDLVLVPSVSETRTDTDFKTYQIINYATTGLGYRGHYFNAEIAYRYRLVTAEQMTNDYQTEPFDFRSNTHAIVLTLGLHN